jgi:hypothetical protein
MYLIQEKKGETEQSGDNKGGIINSGKILSGTN